MVGWLARLHGIEAAVEDITSLSLLLSSLSTALAPQRWLARLHGIEAAVEGITSLSLLLSSLSTALAPQRWLAGLIDCMALRLLWKISPLCHCYFPLYLPLLLPPLLLSYVYRPGSTCPSNYVIASDRVAVYLLMISVYT